MIELKYQGYGMPAELGKASGARQLFLDIQRGLLSAMNIQPRTCPETPLADAPATYLPLTRRTGSAWGGISGGTGLFPKQLHPVQALSGVQAAACLLADAVEQEQRIPVVGDYDADGDRDRLVSAGLAPARAHGGGFSGAGYASAMA
ncbi:MAG: hypothetical protein R3E89_03220 [Thiolinea sp.]